MILLFVLLVFLLSLLWDDVASGCCFFESERFNRLSVILGGSVPISSNNQVDEAERKYRNNAVEDHWHIDSRLIDVVFNLFS